MPLELEPEMEEYLSRLMPGISREWEGATEGEIERIEEIAGRPLPRFYRWFLRRMGRNMGQMTYAATDFSAATVIARYAERLFVPHPRFMMIGYSSDDVMPLHLLYDFEYVVRDDARVARRSAMGGPLHNQFETMREMIAWGECANNRIDELPQRCFGVLGDSDKDVRGQLDPVMKSLGFETPIPTGPYCAIYEKPNFAMISRSTPDVPPEFHIIRLAGSDALALRRILGEITQETSLELKIREWDPPLG